MHKLGLIIQREYLAKVRNKSFVVMTFLSPFLVVGMVVLVAYLTSLNDTETRLITVLNEGGFMKDSWVSGSGTAYVPLQGITLEQAQDSTKSMGYYGLLYIPNRPDLEATAQDAFLYTIEAPGTVVLRTIEDVFSQQLRAIRLQQIGVSAEDFARIRTPFELSTATFAGDRNGKGVNEIKAGLGSAFGYLIMMFIVIYGGFVMRSVIEEKTTRIIEVIISSVRPFELMLGKIVGNALAGVTQFLIWIVTGTVLLVAILALLRIDPAILIEKPQSGPGLAQAFAGSAFAQNDTGQLIITELLSIPIGLLLIFFVIYFVLGYLMYSSIYAAIGAAVDNETDTQQFIFPVIIPLMLAIYVGFFSVFSNPNGPIAVAFSIFPLTSPIVMLMRLPSGIGSGGVALWELLLSLVLLTASFLVMVWLAAKIYRVGILMYGKKPTYRELYKWLKY
ncbi:MAG: hypothetical protein RLZZ241_1923 [Bacteroidota bacterium]|jgi:ABC-2 type transport system permease protein